MSVLIHIYSFVCLIIFCPDVYNFDCRVLQQNRRVVAGTEDRAGELNNFHEVLSDISWGEESDAVRDFIVAAYVRGGACGVAQNCELMGRLLYLQRGATGTHGIGSSCVDVQRNTTTVLK